MDDHDRAYFARGSERRGQALILANDLMHVAWCKCSSGGGGGLHAKQKFELLNPPRSGKRIAITGRVADKYIKRDKQPASARPMEPRRASKRYRL